MSDPAVRHVWRLLAFAVSIMASPAQERVIFNNENGSVVQSGPSRPTVFVLPRETMVTAIRTYHWNDGRGISAGQVTIRNNRGETFGPWPAAMPTAGVYRVVQPNVVLDPGDYTIIDSSPSTWSHNAQSAHAGFAAVNGRAPRAGDPRAIASAVVGKPGGAVGTGPQAAPGSGAATSAGVAGDPASAPPPPDSKPPPGGYWAQTGVADIDSPVEPQNRAVSKFEYAQETRSSSGMVSGKWSSKGPDGWVSTRSQMRWNASASLAWLRPGQKVQFTATLLHEGFPNSSAAAQIRTIAGAVTEPVEAAGGTVTFKGTLEAPRPAESPDEEWDLRFSVWAGQHEGTRILKYRWVSSAAETQ